MYCFHDNTTSKAKIKILKKKNQENIGSLRGKKLNINQLILVFLNGFPELQLSRGF